MLYQLQFHFYLWLCVRKRVTLRVYFTFSNLFNLKTPLKADLSFKTIFTIWAIGRSCVFLIRLLFLTPERIPAKVDEEYSIYENRYLSKNIEETSDFNPGTETEVDERTFSVVAKNYQFYVVVVVIAMYALRGVTFLSWLGAGWPEWIARKGFYT